jgi:heat shock protein HslJ
MHKSLRSKGLLMVSLLVAASMIISACVVPAPAPAPVPEPAPQEPEAVPAPAEGETVTLYVGPNREPCTGVAPQLCYLVKESPDGQYLLFYSAIEGFEFEPGFEYELLVNKQTVPNPPADASSFRWTLIEVVSKTPVEPSAELEGVTWQLIAYLDQNGMLFMPGVESTITLQDGEAGGQGGCNMFFAPYTLDGDQLTFGPAGSTMMACEERAMAQEQAFLTSLEQVASYQIVANQLHMANADGAVILAFEPQVQTPLTGTLWQATMVNNGQGAVVGVVEGTELTATFEADGAVFGSAGCNNYSGGYTVDGNQIAIGPLAMTMMFCAEPEGAMDQEMAFGAALESAAVFSIQGDQLELRTADGALAASFVAVGQAEVEPPAAAESEFSLEGPIWQLTTYVDQSGALAPAEAEATIRFQDGQAGGSTGCNRFFASYTIDGNQLTFSQAGSTMMACPEPAMSQEQAFLTNIGLVASYEIVGPQLQLFDAAGEALLIFEIQVPTPLTGTEWQALNYNNGRGAVTSLVIGTEITAIFAEDGTLSGSAGCNRYTATYTLDGDQISITPVATTMMFCAEPEGVMEQEAEFIAALEMADTFAIEGNSLELRTADGALVASFVAVEEAVAFSGVDEETMAALGNLAYSNTALFTDTVQLVGGIYTETVAPDSAMVAYVELTDIATAGELNGQPAYAVILISNNGGSGVFYDLAVVTEVDGEWTNVATTTLGDRVVINSLAIENNQVVVDMITQGPEDPMCCPTQQVVVAYELQDGALVEVAPVGAAGRSATDSIVGLTWEWVESVYSDDTSVEVYDPNSYTLTLLPDGSVALQVDCNRGGGTYTLDGSQLTLDVAIMTRVACPEGTLSEVFMRDLSAAATYVMDGEDLIINLFADAGNMRFQPGPVAVAVAADVMAMSLDALTLSVEDVADSYEVQAVPATPYDASMPPGPVGAPEHLAVTFDGQSLDEASFEGRVIYIAPVGAYVDLWLDAGNDYIAKSVAALEELLANQPVDPEALPVLPPPPAVMDLAVQTDYLDTPGLDASGVRWVGRFSQDLSPVFNYQLRYLFQGLTADGQYLISASFPVTTPLLPENMEAMTEDEVEAFNEDPQAFLEATASALSFLAPGDFSPSLDALDAMIQSMAISTIEVTVSEPVTPTVTAPLTATQPAAPAEPAVSFSDLTNQDWQWVAFTDAVNGAQEIPSPAKYVVNFVPSGTIRITADCNRGAGQYQVDGASIGVTVQAMTRAQCPAGSLSTQFIQNLNAAAIWFVQDGDLFIDLFADSGTMRFALAE